MILFECNRIRNDGYGTRVAIFPSQEAELVILITVVRRTARRIQPMGLIISERNNGRKGLDENRKNSRRVT